MVERLVNATAAQEKDDEQAVLDAVLAELHRANPAWHANLPKETRDAMVRRGVRRGTP